MELILLLCLAVHPTPALANAPIAARQAVQQGKPAKRKVYSQENQPEGFDQGRAALRRDDYERAAELFQEIVDKHPDYTRAWFLLGYSLQMDGKLEEALQANLQAARGPKTRSSALYNAACACSQMNRLDEAFQYLEQAIDAGFYNPHLMKTDRDLNPLREDPRFEAFLAPVSPSRFFGEDIELHYMFEGEAANDQFGWEGRSAGDVDADGVNDFIISAPYKRAKSVDRGVDGANAGKIYVYSGATGKLILTQAGKPGEFFGIGIDSAGDQNKDGYADLLIGATNWDYGVGKAYVLSGKTGETLLELTSEEPEDAFGWRVSSASDWDGDGVPEYLIGAPSSDQTAKDAGRVYLFSGKKGKLLWSASGHDKNDGFGSCVAATRHCDQRFLVIGSGNAGAKNHGRVFVYEYANEQAQKKFTFEADDTGISLGRFVSIPGDIDGDGRLDFYASDWENCARGRCTGRAYVFSGATGERILTLTGESAGDGFGGSGPANAGDANGDGCDDLLVGAWKNEQGGATAGKVYLYSGRTGELLRSYACTVPRTTFGFDAVGLGDINADGRIDFLITAAWSRGVGEKAGRAFVISGPVPKADGISPDPRLDPTIEAQEDER